MSDCICPEHHYKDRDGYPRVKWAKRLWRLNRLIWFLSFGEIPKGLVVAHKCNNKGCINPEHFYTTTPENNSSDAARDGLYPKGADNHRVRWSDEEIDHMHTLYHIEGFTQQEIGDMFGITQGRVSECIKRADR